MPGSASAPKPAARPSDALARWRAGWRRACRVGPLVEERRRFMVGELLGRPGAHEYHLRDADGIAVLRHNGFDAHVLREVVRDPFYTPPEPVRTMLGHRPGGPRVVDLGGNIGLFGMLVLRLYPSARITSFEPEPSNLAVLRRCIEVNGYDDRWDVVPACATTVDGVTAFVGGQGALSRVPLPGDVSGDSPTTTVPTVDVFPHLVAVDLLKIDIEGGEWALLDDPRFAEIRPPAVLLEWHSYDCPEDNPRRAAAARLERLGYEIRHEKPAPVPDDEPLYGAGTLWAWSAERR